MRGAIGEFDGKISRLLMSSRRDVAKNLADFLIEIETQRQNENKEHENTVSTNHISPNLTDLTLGPQAIPTKIRVYTSTSSNLTAAHHKATYRLFFKI